MLACWGKTSEKLWKNNNNVGNKEKFVEEMSMSK